MSGYEEHISDASDVLSEQVGSSVEKGTVNLFGKTFQVGSGMAYAFDLAYEWFLPIVSEKGAAYFRKLGHGAAKNVFKTNDATAEKFGQAGDMVFRYGSLVWDVGVGTTKTVMSGYREMDEVNKAIQPYLAANHGFNVSISSVLSDPNRGIRNVRSAVMERSKFGLWKNLATLAVRIPTLLKAYWDQKLQRADAFRESWDSLGEPERKRALDEFTDLLDPSNGKVSDNLATKIHELQESNEFKDWQRKNTGRDFTDYLKMNPSVAFGFLQYMMDPKNLKNTFNQLFRPKSEKELVVNYNLLDKSPILTGLLKRFVNEKFNVAIDDRNVDQFAIMQIARKAASWKKALPDSHEELAQEILGFFKSHFEDCEIRKSPDYRKLSKISEELASAIMDHGLNPYALIDLICGDKLVKYAKGDFVYTATQERTELIEKEFAKYTAKVDNKEFYRDAGMKPEDVKKIYDNLGAEERSFFVMLFPAGILEAQGISRKELEKIRKQNREECTSFIAHVMTEMKNLTSDDLKQKYGIPENEAKALLSIAEDYSSALESYGNSEARSFLTKHRKQLSNAILKAGIGSNDPQFWRKMVRAGNEESEEVATAKAGREDDKPEGFGGKVKRRAQKFTDEMREGMEGEPDWSPARS